VLNFLYCFDSNYNIQATLSIYSLLEKVDKKINIFVIHKENSFLDILNKKVTNHKNLNTIEVFKFREKNIKFPNLKNNHISEATYYRLFISQYLPKEIKYITYLDADIICTDNPSKEILNIQQKLDDKNFVGVKTEIRRKKGTEQLFENLDMQNDIYFNAGVMIIDLELWKKKNVEKIAQKKMMALEGKIQFWDQDILNSILDGNFYEINPRLNYIISLNSNNENQIYNYKKINTVNIPMFIHYAGSSKPWSLEGIFSPNSKYYQKYYQKIFNQKYHLVIKWKSFAIKLLFKKISDKSIYKIDFPFSLVGSFIREILRK
tara:strand:+ start:486 stop:1442 length:957 start_codon:yes stop_codon:yes gene_type:complete